MSLVRSLRIVMDTVNVGSLFELDDGRSYFRFDEAYAMMPEGERPVLSQAFEGDSEAETRSQLLDPALEETRGDGKRGLPPFFENLLPEGRLRRQLVEEAGIEERDSLGLLAYCGSDLPGNVQAQQEKLTETELGRLLTQGNDSFEMSSAQMPAPESTSLSGVQPKIALVRVPGGRYVMRSKNSGGHFIGKLPASDFPQMPEVEHASLDLARAAGVTTCDHELLPLTAIAGQLHEAMREDSTRFLLVHRFDRDANTPNHRLHAEDMAQVTSTLPQNKYSLSYADLGLVLLKRSVRGEDDVHELLRRLTVNELIGNPDAHLKNFGFLYGTPRAAELSPAYDIVAYSAWNRSTGHGLKLVDGAKAREISPAVVRQWANHWGMPEAALSKTITTTVDAAMRSWEGVLAAATLTEQHRTRIWEHVRSTKLAARWLKRNS
ncbi:type II toxin-antitoxin system HipA family toxin [Paraburkholderia sp. SIMBA_054]|uniref:type II toxin-antitoxin system HipA family toxin n=1 Tax=Paraburkholderia sp. SIMBA_054 TaxID=3085795 RepID=UPI00397B43EC